MFFKTGNKLSALAILRGMGGGVERGKYVAKDKIPILYSSLKSQHLCDLKQTQEFQRRLQGGCL